MPVGHAVTATILIIILGVLRSTVYLDRWDYLNLGSLWIPVFNSKVNVTLLLLGYNYPVNAPFVLYIERPCLVSLFILLTSLSHLLKLVLGRGSTWTSLTL